MLSLAIPTFTGIPTDIVKKIDAYAEMGTDLQNELVSKVSAFESNIDGIIHDSLTVVNGIGDMIKEGLETVESAKNRIKDVLGSSRAAITNMAKDLENEIISDITGSDLVTGFVSGANTLVNSAKVVIDGVSQTFRAIDFPEISGVVGVIKDLTGNQLIEIFDIGAQAALMRGVVSTVTGWGIPQMVDEIFGAKWNEKLNKWAYDYDDDFRFSVTKRASENISPSSSLDVISTLMLHGGEKALVADNPQFPDQLLQGYVIPTGCVPGGPFPVDPLQPYGAQTTPNYMYECWLLKDILTRLKPNWFYVERTYRTGDPAKPFTDDRVWNLVTLSRMSEDAVTILNNDPDLRSAIMAAPFYRPESGIALIKMMYPYFVS